eukprot:2394190-Alexandrium_andersonii.AAC.1
MAGWPSARRPAPRPARGSPWTRLPSGWPAEPSPSGCAPCRSTSGPGLSVSVITFGRSASLTTRPGTCSGMPLGKIASFGGWTPASRPL